MTIPRVKLNGNGNGKAVIAADDLVGAVAKPQKFTAAQYAEAITASWQQAVHSIIRTGQLLCRAKKELRHGEFGQMIDSKLPFSASTAQRLMKIAEHPILSNPAHVQHLPASWGTLYELTKLPDEELEPMLANGKINAGTERKEVEEILTKIREHGLYRFGRLVEALRTVADFGERWPDPSKIAKRLDLEEEEDSVSLDELAKMPAWIEALHRAAQHEAEVEAARDAEYEAQLKAEAEEEEDEEEVGRVMGAFRPRA